MKLFFILSLTYLTLTSCVFGQTEKPLLTSATTTLLANEICTCLKKDSTATNIPEVIQKCYVEVLIHQNIIISAELGVDIVKSNDLELGKKIGAEILVQLLKICSVYNSMIVRSASQNIIDQAEQLRADGKYKEALKGYNTVCTIDIDKTVLNARGLCKYELGDYYGALADFEYAIQKDSMYATAYSNRGLAKRKLEKISDALTDYDKAIELDYNTAIFYGNRGILYYENDYYEDAEKDLKKAIQKDTTVASYYYYLGQTKRLNKELTDQTAKYYDKAILLAPKNTGYLNDRGLFYWDKNDLPKAKMNFLETIQIDKNYNPAYYNLSRLASDTKLQDEALKLIVCTIFTINKKDKYCYRKIVLKMHFKNLIKPFFSMTRKQSFIMIGPKYMKN
jgi:tetratricopeptide (TPR) repeat protein